MACTEYGPTAPLGRLNSARLKPAQEVRKGGVPPLEGVVAAEYIWPSQWEAWISGISLRQTRGTRLEFAVEMAARLREYSRNGIPTPTPSASGCHGRIGRQGG